MTGDSLPPAAHEEDATTRPWTPAAAMEPVPPLAPPPARPGAGTAVVTTERAPAVGGRVRALVVVGALAVVVLVLLLVVRLGH